jgi:cysteine synthase
MKIADSMLQAIGNTPLVQLNHVVPSGSARVLIKLEGLNPSGSMKDRMAYSMITCAEADGRLQPGRPVVEYTGGSTGTSLAFICAAKGYKLYLVCSDAFSKEKRDHMVALGAELFIVPSEGGYVTKDLFQWMREATDKIVAEQGAFWTDQFNNVDQAAGYEALGNEIWAQTEGRIDAFVHVVGTGGSMRGTSTTLRKFKPGLRVVAVEPAESPVMSGGKAGAHQIEGIGTGNLVPHWSPSLANEIMTVSTADAKAMARRLAREEALFGGTSTGANVTAALRVAEQLGADATVVTLNIDNGLKYLSTDVFTGG